MERTSEKLKFNFNVTKQDAIDLLLASAGFFTGRILIFNIANPFSAAYISSFLFLGNKFYVSAVFAAIGMATVYRQEYSLKYFVCLAMMTILNIMFGTKTKKIRAELQSGAAAGCLVLSGLLLVFLRHQGVYYVLTSVLEGVLVFALGIIFKKGVGSISVKSKRGALNGEELISVAVFAGCIAAGSADIYIGVVSLRYFLCALIVMATSQSGGAAVGATAGLMLGVLLNITGYEYIYFSVILATAGFFCGSLKSRHRIFAILGFIVAGAVCTLFFDLEFFSWALLFSVILASIAFYFIPNQFMLNIYSSISPAYSSSGEYMEKVKSLTSHRIEKYSHAFAKLAGSFGSLAEKKEGLSRKDVNNLIDDVAAKACIGCPNSDSCWVAKFYETYQSVFGILSVCEKSGSVSADDAPSDFKDFCINIPAFCEAVNRYYDLYKVNTAWHNRMIESRAMVSEQLTGVSQVLSKLSRELEAELCFKSDYESKILEELNKNKIEVENVIVLENMAGKYEVTFSQKPQRAKRNYEKEIGETLTCIIGRKMEKAYDEYCIDDNGTKKMYRMQYLEQQRFCITSGIARTVKTNAKESGDSYSFMELKDGQCLLALSDGMGSGRRAREESKAAIELLEEFIESGFDKDTSVKLINSALLLKSSEETFSTLDICSVDMQTGASEFIKIGAASTFLMRNGDVEVIRSWSLPVGILDTVDVDVSQKKLRHGDIIIMMTDGVLDSGEDEEHKDSWVVKNLKGLKSSNPQDIADFLLDKAKENYGMIVKDDMTVLAARIWEKI